MKKLLGIFLLFVSTLGYSTVDCTTMQFLASSNDAIKISLPTTPNCDNPDYKIYQRVFASGPFTPSNFTLSTDGTKAKIHDLDPCKKYQFRVGVFCDGVNVGGCANGQPFGTQCNDPTCDCINFIGIGIVDQEGCKAKLVMDFNAGSCGEISILNYSWDFGYPGNSGGNTEVVTHAFPGDGIYTVTAKLTYKLSTGEVCTEVRTRDIKISDCSDPCECIKFDGAAVVDYSECKYEMVMDFNAGDCGEISIIDYAWDFGYPGNGGANTEVVTHVFPSNGIYVVTTKLTFKIVETGEVCTAVRETEIKVTDCSDPCECIKFDGAAVVGNYECKYEMVMDFNAGDCGEISIVDYAWDFGYPGNGGANTEVVTHEFPSNGLYVITTKLTFKIVETGEICTAVRETELMVDDCSDPCECINFWGAAVVDQSECKYEMVMDFNAGTCGEISILGYSWDFGYPGNGGASTEVVTHEFPSNGVYTITTKLAFKIVETGEVCVVVREVELIVSDCPPDPCECINFWGAAVVDQSECKYEMVMDFNAGTCGEISIVDYAWDFGYPGNGGANTEVVTHVFPSNGVYTITTKLTFKIVETGEICTVVRETELIVDDCTDPCECIKFDGAAVVDQSECKYEMVMDFNAGDCGEISIVEYAWDFGYPGNGGANTEVVTHEFPSNGIYIITTKLTFKIVETGEICTAVRETELVVDDCDPCDCINFFGIEIVAQDECKAEFVMDFNAGTCGEISIVSYEWDFGYPGNGGGNTEVITHVFPSNGIYTVTGKLTFKIVATGEICEAKRSVDIKITDCPPTCDCIFFPGIEIVGQDECKAEFVMDFNAGTCGEISIGSYEWDFGYPGNGGGNTEVITHVFPANGIYTVTGKLTFKIVETGEICEVKRTVEIKITDCNPDPCDCINFFGIEILGQKNCKAQFVMDFNAGTCGEISIGGYEWDFGYPGNGGGNTEVITHVFPSNGIYTVTGKLTFKIVETGEICEVKRSVDIKITNCEGFTGGDGTGRSLEGDEGTSSFEVTAFPNPFRNVVDLSINTDVDELVNIDVLDINGRVVFNNSTDLQKGQNTYQLNLGHLPSGIYFYSLSTSTAIKTGKIIKE